MNEHFVNIKVDREERPDLDAIYMEAVQAMSGQGGWPMTVFLDPDGARSTAAPTSRPTRAAACRASGWCWKPSSTPSSANARRSASAPARPARGLGADRRGRAGRRAPRGGDAAKAVERLLRGSDRERGGFGGAPKFPPASALELLLARGETARLVERQTPRRDDGRRHLRPARRRLPPLRGRRGWLVPHFEKMLYDNALLARAYLHGWQALGHDRYRRVCEETLDWVLREMRGPEGGFYSALDADTEGEEGRFYVWTPGADPRRSSAATRTLDPRSLEQFYGVTEARQLRGRQHPPPRRRRRRAEPPERARRGPARPCYEARAKRVWPGLDDKRLASWNALTIAALAEAGAVLGREDYLDAARACADFVLDRCATRSGRLLRTYKDGRAHLNAYLEDHAFLLEALLVLYEATFEQRWFEQARTLAETMIARFGDPERGGFFSTSEDHEELIARRKEIGDHPIPSGNSSAALGLLRLGALTGEREYERQAEGVLRLFAGPAPDHPDGLRPPPAGARLPPGPDQGGRPRRRRPERARRASSATGPPPPGPRRRRGEGRARRRCSPNARGRGQARPPTSARASPAGAGDHAGSLSALL